MSKSIADGQQFHVYVQAGSLLKLAWLGGTYSVFAKAGLPAGQTILALDSGANLTLGPWPRNIVANIVTSAPGCVEFAVGNPPEFGPPGKEYVRQSDGVKVVLTGIGPSAAFVEVGGGSGGGSVPFTVTGIFALNEVLTIVPSTGWDVASIQWKRKDADGNVSFIAGANATTYTLVDLDVAEGVSVLATASPSTYSSTPIGSTTPPSNPPPAFTSQPVIIGVSQAGQVLTAIDGEAIYATSVTRQWYLNGAAVSGQTGQSFTLTSAHVGQIPTVRNFATGPGGGPITSNAATAAAVASSGGGSSNGQILLNGLPLVFRDPSLNLLPFVLG